jgi:hypothetical protein
MKFPSNNPHKEYKFIKRNGLKIYLLEDDKVPTTIQKSKAFCDRHGISWKLFSKIYYLRGNRNKAEYGEVMIGALESGKRLPKALWEVIHCLTFWNQEGMECHQMNAESNESYQDFILKCMASDCRAFVKPFSHRYITGTGGNHVWIADKKSGERILIFHF